MAEQFLREAPQNADKTTYHEKYKFYRLLTLLYMTQILKTIDNLDMKNVNAG